MRVVGPCLAVSTLFLFYVLHLMASAPKVRLDVMPAKTVAPITSWHLRAWVDRNDLNRNLRIEARGQDYERSTDIALEGGFAPRVHEIWWHGTVPCGLYYVAASVLGPSGQLLAQARTTAEICVEGP